MILPYRNLFIPVHLLNFSNQFMACDDGGPSVKENCFHCIPPGNSFLNQIRNNMKKTIFCLLAIAAFASCNNEAAKVEPKQEEVKAAEPQLTMPYSAAYSSQFTIGDQKNAQKLLELFKQWDDNKLADGKSMFADSVHFFSDKWVFHGTNDSFQVVSQQQRDLMKECRTVVHAWIPAHSTDKNEDWVLIWSTSYTTDNKGKADSVSFQDSWRLNKDGKFDVMRQFVQHFPENK
jgi:hypothetical protein